MIQTTLRLPEELYQRLKEVAKQQGVSVNSLVVMILWRAEEQEGRDKDGRTEAFRGSNIVFH